MKAGTNLTYERSSYVSLNNYNGIYNFSSIQNYIQDIPTSIGIALGNPDLDFREHDNFFYIGDDLQGTKNLTLNFGLSYAYFGQPANLFHRRDEANETSPRHSSIRPSPFGANLPTLPPERGLWAQRGFRLCAAGGRLLSVAATA